jgi:hypothetical protein
MRRSCSEKPIPAGTLQEAQEWRAGHECQDQSQGAHGCAARDDHQVIEASRARREGGEVAHIRTASGLATHDLAGKDPPNMAMALSM